MLHESTKSSLDRSYPGPHRRDSLDYRLSHLVDLAIPKLRKHGERQDFPGRAFALWEVSDLIPKVPVGGLEVERDGVMDTRLDARCCK